MKGIALFVRGNDNGKRENILTKLNKMVFCRAIIPNRSKLGIDHPWEKGFLALLALSKCVYWFELVSQVSDVSQGLLFNLGEK